MGNDIKNCCSDLGAHRRIINSGSRPWEEKGKWIELVRPNWEAKKLKSSRRRSPKVK